MNEFGVIYVAVNKANGKAYVGQTTRTVNRRWGQHLSQVRKGFKDHFHNALRCHGSDSFHVSTVAVAQSKEQLDQLEKLWIVALRVLDRKYGYNDKGGGSNGSPTAETRAKISKALMGRPGTPHTAEGREKLRQAHLGKKQGAPTPEHRQKLSKALKGTKRQPCTQEHKDRISKSKRSLTPSKAALASRKSRAKKQAALLAAQQLTQQ